MKEKLRLTDIGTHVLQMVKRRIQLNGQPDYVPMRIAFGRSMMSEKEPVIGTYNDEIKAKSKENKSQKELSISMFEQRPEEGLAFRALLSQRYGYKVESDDYIDKLEKHIEHGVWLMYNETEKISGFDYIIGIANAAQNKLKRRQNSVYTEGSSTERVPQDADVLSVRIGIDKKTGTPITYKINTANNPHIGIMGGSGSGKTYFLKHLLQQIRENSHYETHFVIFDYAKGDIAGDTQFIIDSKAEIVDVKRKPLPLNIFADAVSTEAEQRSKAEKIVNLFKNVEANIGKVQEDNLYNAILNAYQNSATYPDFDKIRDELRLLNSKPDSLTSILRPLVEQNYFTKAEEMIWLNWTNKTLIIDLHEIERKDLVCFLILDQIFTELKKLGDAPFNKDKGARKIRTVVVIDEAHNFLSVPKRAKILERMIREVRSMGGMVILASQSPDDYNTAQFDFLELLEFPIVLKSTPQSAKFLEQKFSVSAAYAKDLLKDIGKLNRGEAFLMNDGKVVLGELTK